MKAILEKKKGVIKMVATVKVYNIEWDVDLCDLTTKEKNKIENELPKEVVVDVEEYGLDYIEDYINNYLSDRYGWCTLGWDYKTIKQSTDDGKLDLFWDDMETGILDDEEF